LDEIQEEAPLAFYTRGGDSGQTGLLSGERVAKDHLRVETYGTLDELQSQIGMARSICGPGDIADALYSIQQDLFAICSELAADSDQSRLKRRIAAPDLKRIEGCIDDIVERYGLPGGFVVPGQGWDSAAVHVSRSVCRRCERLLVSLLRKEGGREVLLAYMNRVGDLLFILAWALQVRSTIRSALVETIQGNGGRPV
jgi:cob(I)alamin adenosyltransferase